MCALAATVAVPGCYLTHELPPPSEDPVEPAAPEPAPLVLHPQIARGSGHACVLLDDGSVHCWGSNTFGQLGVPREDGSSVLDEGRPVRVEGLPLIQQISAGSAQTCALDVHGRVHCWGLNEQGQLGVGMDAAPDECTVVEAQGPQPYDCAQRPVEVPGVDRVIQISAGGTHACALRADREVLCWGWMAGALNPSFELASLSAEDRSTVRGDYYVRSVPTVVDDLAPAAQVAAGSNAQGPGHSCAVVDGGSLQCWGNSHSGQTGPTPPLHTTLTSFELPAPAVHVAAGSAHSCAVTDGGEVYCWGANHAQELGVDTGYGDCQPFGTGISCQTDQQTWRITTPVRVEGISGAVAVSIHGDGYGTAAQSCALLQDKTITCWSGGERWQVGGVSDVVQLSGNCATVRDGRVLCWEGNGAATVVPEVHLAYAEH